MSDEDDWLRPKPPLRVIFRHLKSIATLTSGKRDPQFPQETELRLFQLRYWLAMGRGLSELPFKIAATLFGSIVVTDLVEELSRPTSSGRLRKFLRERDNRRLYNACFRGNQTYHLTYAPTFPRLSQQRGAEEHDIRALHLHAQLKIALQLSGRDPSRENARKLLDVLRGDSDAVSSRIRGEKIGQGMLDIGYTALRENFLNQEEREPFVYSAVEVWPELFDFDFHRSNMLQKLTGEASEAEKFQAFWAASITACRCYGQINLAMRLSKWTGVDGLKLTRAIWIASDDLNAL